MVKEKNVVMVFCHWVVSVYPKERLRAKSETLTHKKIDFSIKHDKLPLNSKGEVFNIPKELYDST